MIGRVSPPSLQVGSKGFARQCGASVIAELQKGVTAMMEI